MWGETFVWTRNSKCNVLSKFVDGTEMSHMTGDGMELEEPSRETEEIEVPPEPELPAEFEKLYKGCEDNPEDFNGWVYLLQYVEQEVGWRAQ